MSNTTGMKVCFISDYFEGGGAEIYIHALEKMLRERGHEVFLVIDEDLNREKTAQETNCYKVPRIGKPNNTAQLEGYAEHTKDTLRLISEILQLEEPEILHVHNVFNPYLLNGISDLGFPVVKTLHDVRPFAPKLWTESSSENGLEATWTSLMLRSLLKLPKVFIFSDFLRHVVETSEPSMKSKMVLLPPFSPVQVLSQESVYHDAAPRPSGDGFDVLFLGRICYEKGAYEIIEMAKAAEFEGTNFVMAGLVLDSNIDALIARQNNVLLEGFLSPTKVAKLISKSKLLVFPSLANETLGFSLVDALSFGRPVVAYNTGAVEELLLQGHTGFLVPRENIDELKAKTLILLQDCALRARMGQYAREYAQHWFSSESHVDKLLDVYGEVVHDSTQSRPTHTH